MRRCHCLQWFLAMVAFTLWVPGAFAQSGSAVESGPGAEASRKPELPGAGVRRFRLEARGFDNIVSNDFGHWVGTGLNLSYQQSDRLAVSGGLISQWRPGETERLFAFGALVNWSEWFYTNLELSGGGPDNPAAFFPQLRYDATANLKIPPLPGLILTGGLTRLYFGSPVNGRVSRAGAIYYWRNFVFQGSLNFNNVRPGNRKVEIRERRGPVRAGRQLLGRSRSRRRSGGLADPGAHASGGGVQQLQLLRFLEEMAQSFLWDRRRLQLLAETHRLSDQRPGDEVLLGFLTIAVQMLDLPPQPSRAPIGPGPYPGVG